MKRFYPLALLVALVGLLAAQVSGAALGRALRAVLNTGAVSTLAGAVGSPGSSDGAGSAARFHHPTGIAVDAGGTVYVADHSSSVIRRISPAGVVSTFAGMAGNRGSADGQGSAARFNYPYGLAVDAAGTLYVADQNNHIIRKISPAGAVTTLAGLATYHGSTDGPGASARFNSPAGVAVDAAGTVYVADQGNHTIRKITAAGVVTTLAGRALSGGFKDTLRTYARFQSPAGIAVSAAGTVYVADQENRLIRKISPAGMVTTYAGVNGESGHVEGFDTARFNFPTGVAVDGTGTVYVADRLNHVLRRITPARVVRTVAGSQPKWPYTPPIAGSTDATGNAARFNCPAGVAVDAAGNVYVADQGNHVIRVIR